MIHKIFLTFCALMAFSPVSSFAASDEEMIEQTIDKMTQFISANYVLCKQDPDKDIAWFLNRLRPANCSEEMNKYLELTFVKGMAKHTMEAMTELQEKGTVSFSGTPLRPDSCPQLQKHWASIKGSQR